MVQVPAESGSRNRSGRCESVRGQDPDIPAPASGGERIPSSSGSRSLGHSWGWMEPPTLGRVICFTESTDSNADYLQKHRDTRTHSKTAFSQTLGTLWLRQGDT